MMPAGGSWNAGARAVEYAALAATLAEASSALRDRILLVSAHGLRAGDQQALARLWLALQVARYAAEEAYADVWSSVEDLVRLAVPRREQSLLDAIARAEEAAAPFMRDFPCSRCGKTMRASTKSIAYRERRCHDCDRELHPDMYA